MLLLRTPAALTRVARRSFPTSIRQPIAIRPLSSSQPRFAQGYGDGEGDPKGENPQDQGSSNGVKQHAEHPGPEPVAEGQGSGAGPTKGGSGKSPEDASAQSGGSRSKEAKETGSSPTGGEVGGETEGGVGGKSNDGGKAQPKIHDHKPSVDTAEKQAEVEQHNKEFEQRHDRASPAAADQVDKRFWKGQGGVDEQS